MRTYNFPNLTTKYAGAFPESSKPQFGAGSQFGFRVVSNDPNCYPLIAELANDELGNQYVYVSDSGWFPCKAEGLRLIPLDQQASLVSVSNVVLQLADRDWELKMAPPAPPSLSKSGWSLIKSFDFADWSATTGHSVAIDFNNNTLVDLGATASMKLGVGFVGAVDVSAYKAVTFVAYVDHTSNNAGTGYNGYVAGRLGTGINDPAAFLSTNVVASVPSTTTSATISCFLNTGTQATFGGANSQKGQSDPCMFPYLTPIVNYNGTLDWLGLKFRLYGLS